MSGEFLKRTQGRPSLKEVNRIDEAIQKAALAEVAALGMCHASIEGMAVRAGVTKAAIYRRFANKQALLCAAIDTRVAVFKLRLAIAREEAADPLDFLYRFMKLLSDDADDQEGIDLRRLLIGIGPLPGPLCNKLVQIRREFDALIDTAIVAAVDVGQLINVDVPELRDALLDLLVNGRVSDLIDGGQRKGPHGRAKGVFERRWAWILESIVRHKG